MFPGTAPSEEFSTPVGLTQGTAQALRVPDGRTALLADDIDDWVVATDECRAELARIVDLLLRTAKAPRIELALGVPRAIGLDLLWGLPVRKRFVVLACRRLRVDCDCEPYEPEAR